MSISEIDICFIACLPEILVKDAGLRQVYLSRAPLKVLLAIYTSFGLYFYFVFALLDLRDPRQTCIKVLAHQFLELLSSNLLHRSRPRQGKFTLTLALICFSSPIWKLHRTKLCAVCVSWMPRARQCTHLSHELSIFITYSMFPSLVFWIFASPLTLLTQT